ncbi:MAG: ABC transporter permease [Gammaproteobacteria bacterium]|nr:ABC transporter permease [Gammaproteobacteria bacterium]
MNKDQAVSETLRSPLLTPRLRAPVLRWVPVWQRNFRVWYKLAIPAILGNFGEPLLYLLALGYGLGSLVGAVQDMPYLVFLASGIVCSSTMVTATFEGMYSAYTRMEVQKTWDAMLATPLDIRDVVIGEALWASTKSVFSGAAILIVAAALGAVAGWMALLTLPVMLLTGLCFAAMALVVTAFARNYDFFLYYYTLLVTPMLLASGVFFPLQHMPEVIQWGAHILPLTHAVELVRPLITGTAPHQPVLHLLVLIGYAVITIVLAVRLIRRRLMN